mgnify:CR=1 FL=1
MKSINHTIFKKKGYIHFDEPISPQRAWSIASNPKTVTSWPFMPFLQCLLENRKVMKNASGHLIKNTKERQICYSTHKDAAIFTYYSHLLTGLHENHLEELKIGHVSTAFRPSGGKCNINHAKEIFDFIKSMGNCTVLAFDIKGFFDNLDHKTLKYLWAKLLGESSLPDDHYAVFKAVTRYSFVEREKALEALGVSKNKPRAFRRRRLCNPDEFRNKIQKKKLINRNKDPFGIPQGSPISAVLSNIYMTDFDSEISLAVEKTGGMYRRYCDDIICVIRTEQAPALNKLVLKTIRTLKIEIQSEKTLIHNFSSDGKTLQSDSPLQYLGFLFDGERVLLRNAGLGRYYSKMRSGVNLAAQTKKKWDKKLNRLPAENPIRRKKLNILYSYIGQHNYLSYAYRAAKEFGSVHIKKQVRKHWIKLNQEIEKRDKSP